MPDTHDYSWIYLRSDYMGPDDFYARLSVYIDGKRRGLARYGDYARIPVYPGPHTLRVKIYGWYGSPSVQLDVLPGSILYLRGDIPRSGNLLIRILKGMLAPWRWLVLEQVAQEPGDPAQTPVRGYPPS
jgi:hypothetical protein